MKRFILIFTAIVFLISCKGASISAQDIMNPQGKTLAERFAPPAGYERTPAAQGSFAAYLRALPLKEQGEKIKYFDGRTKHSLNTVYISVIDMPISARDLQQCADAVMRLYGEYQFSQKNILK
ncbi:hypothetical protein Dip510_000396 [Elusimicrobium posterum]|uniref:DUF4846 domain-containing protein n=1 Tax=Elusimicrobium posterum TaxID=3116653 RepID=UPI003C7924F2